MSDKFDVKDECAYTKDHEWAKPRDGGLAVGITAYAVDQLGDITLVNLDVGEGDAVTVGKPFGTIESVKTLSDLYAPVSGKVVRVNRELETRPELVNEDCYGAGWMVVVEPSDPSETNALLSAKAYRDLLAAEAH
jgi:glycine cleavage system H protein